MHRQWNRSAAAALGLAALALTAPTAVAKAHHRYLPKGTPYGAEVKLEVTGTVDIHRVEKDRASYCSDGSVIPESLDDTVQLEWSSTWPQVTVPVAYEQELGKAAARLFLDSTPTADATAFALHGTYDFSDVGVSADGCSSGPEGASGTLGSLVIPLLGHYTPANAGELPIVPLYKADTFSDWVFQLGDVSWASPSSYTTDSGSAVDTADAARSLLGQIPAQSDQSLTDQTLANWNELGATMPVAALHALLSQSEVELPDVQRSGTIDCNQDEPYYEPGSNSCTITWSITYHRALHRYFLYRTKRRYQVS